LEKLWNLLSEFTEDTILGSVMKSIKKQVKDKIGENKKQVQQIIHSKRNLTEHKQTKYNSYL
jgi:hypothetical protein